MDGASPWTLFRWQHGIERQGLGNLISAVVLSLTGWNSRADAAAGAVLMLLTCLCALWLVKRVCGRMTPWDAAVPLIFITTTNIETYVITPNLAHGPLSALYLVVYGLALTATSHVRRAALIAVINFFAVNTGFTVVLGAITPIVLLLLAIQPGLLRRDRIVYGAACAASIATVAQFMHGLVWYPAVACFQFPDEHPWNYVPFAGRVLARPVNPKIGLLPGEPLGTAFALAATVFMGYALFRAVQSRGNSTLWNVTGVLMAFTIAFAVTTAVGRVCIGIGAADASRYIPYVLPGLLAVHLALRCGLPSSRAKLVALGVFLAICVGKESSGRSRREATHESGLKRAWHDCYLAEHDIAACNASAGRPVYPAPAATDLQRKLDWLEARGYNLFQDRDRK
jgi:hypothetical protein